jgi:hypothetical protein
MIGFRQVVDQTSTYALLSPSTAVPPEDTGLFYPVAPDVAIAQVMFMGGITLAMLGVLALAPALRLPRTRSLRPGGGIGRLLPAVAVAVVVAGAAAAGTAYALTAAGANSAQWGAGFQQEFLTMFVASRPQGGPHQFMSNVLSPAQQAVVTALMTAVGSQPVGFAQADDSNGRPVGPSPAQIAAAAERFAALSPAARHAWLAAHLPALRADQITLAQLP